MENTPNNKKEKIRENMMERQKEAKTVRKLVMIITITFVLFVGGAILGGFVYVSSSLKPLNPENDQTKTVEIPIGSSVEAIAGILEKEEIIKDGTIFKYYIKFKNESDFQAGVYELAPSMTLDTLIESLKTGRLQKEVAFKMTVPEGLWLEDIAFIISEQTGQTKEEVFQTLNDPAFIEKLSVDFPFIITDAILDEQIKFPLEGYLFPATYSFYEDDDKTTDSIVRKMLSKTSDVLLGYQSEMNKEQLTVHDVLTLASLIEEEATANVDRKSISSVFHNRMEIDMALQTDPTVLYAQGEHKGQTMYKDLKFESPYNTYLYPGLPPGPIANPGVTSIEAALNPAETEYLFFLATPEGKVLYSQTLEEHNQKKAEHITES